MSDKEELTIEEAFGQVRTIMLALAQLAANEQESSAMALLGNAVFACRQQGFGDTIALDLYQRTFPGKPLPRPISRDDFVVKFADSKT